MTYSTLNFHRAIAARAKAHHSANTHWLGLTFTTADGSDLAVAIFCDSPEALLAQLAAEAIEAAQKDAYAEGRADEREEHASAPSSPALVTEGA